MLSASLSIFYSRRLLCVCGGIMHVHVHVMRMTYIGALQPGTWFCELNVQEEGHRILKFKCYHCVVYFDVYLASIIKKYSEILHKSSSGGYITQECCSHRWHAIGVNFHTFKHHEHYCHLRTVWFCVCEIGKVHFFCLFNTLKCCLK